MAGICFDWAMSVRTVVPMSAARRRRLRWLGGALLLVAVGCFVFAYQQIEANWEDAQTRAAVLGDLPGVQEEVSTPAASHWSLALGVLTGAVGFGCLLLGLPPRPRPPGQS